MPLLQLTNHTIFDATDGAGILLDTQAGNYWSLNPVATVMLEAAIAAPAMIGDSSTPNIGYRIPAAMGMPSTL